MLGAVSEAAARSAAPGGVAATLAPAPDGLSIRRAEQALGLPAGAWHRRRLYALRLNGRAYEFLGFRDGDFLIVEPGRTEKPGSVVVARGTHGTSVRRVAARHAEDSMPTVLELPLRERRSEHREHVVGIVAGVLRPTGTGALRPVPVVAPRRRQLHRRGARPRPERREGEASALRSTIDLEGLRIAWRAWLEKQEKGGHADLARWRRLEASLTALCDCLAHSSSAALRKALSSEAEAVAAAIRREMMDSRTC